LVEGESQVFVLLFGVAAKLLFVHAGFAGQHGLGHRSVAAPAAVVLQAQSPSG
jgi:hypothetical protein